MQERITQLLREGLNYHQAGRLDLAEALYRQVLEQDPRQPDALHLLGVSFAQRREFAEAEQWIRRAILVEPQAAGYYQSLGNILNDTQRYAEAIDVLRHALALKPDLVEAQLTLAAALLNTGFSRKALEVAQAAIALAPALSRTHLTLGLALGACGNVNEAIASFRSALARDPRSSQARLALGQVLAGQGLLQEAVEYFRSVAKQEPQNGAVFNELGLALKDQGKTIEAIECFRQSLALRPDAATHSNLLLTLHYPSGTSPREIFREHVEWGRLYASPTTASSPRGQDPHSPKLRVAYISADLRRHPVQCFIEPILSHHDREKFEITCYANVAEEDETSRRLASWVDRWRNVRRLTDRELIDQILEDRIDILVDLSGHSGGNRLTALAAKPAPIQITWLGYPNTTGVPAIDFRLTDATADPPGVSDTLNVERLIRIDPCAWCYAPPADAPDVAPLPAINNRFITFGSLNNFAKVSDAAVTLWARVLHEVPDSRLLIKALGLRDESTRQRLRESFEADGIAPDRLDLRGPVASLADHLATYADIDVALDTFPYNGTTTTCEALWMGAPVITRAGETHVSRVGASLLSAAGLRSCIADSDDRFLNSITQLTSDLSALAHLRKSLRDQLRKSPLLDAARFTRNLESTCKILWQQRSEH